MKILVVGDYIEDFYIFGTAVRLCPEAPVPVVIPHIERTTAGGVGLVANQLRELGAEVHEWRGSLSRKERTFCESHLVMRIDRDCLPFEPEPFPDRMLELCDAVVVADYGKGAVEPILAAEIVSREKPCFVDAKHHFARYPGKFVTIFPNQHELPIERYWTWGRVVRKFGSDGCDMVEGTSVKLQLPATISEVVDVTGAGDVFIAAFTYAAICEKLTAEDSLRFANELAGESCRHRGTFVVGREFAQSVLGRIRASGELQQQGFGQAWHSMLAGLAPMSARGVTDPEAIAYYEELQKSDIPQSDWSEGRARMEMDRQTRESERMLRQSPSGPTESSDVPTPKRIDQESSSKQPWEG